MSKYGFFSDPYFPVFRLNTGKYGPEKSPYLDIFHAVNCYLIYWDKNRDRGGSACYVRGDKSYPTENYVPNEIGSICLEIS